MQTCKAISTISYNSKEFLVSRLNLLVKMHIIDFYMFIEHIGEITFTGEKEKDHIHLFIVPNHRINTAELDEQFIELDPNNIKPKKCISWSVSKSDDWILYALHDPNYLMSKMEKRQIQYKYTDLKSSDYDDLERRYRIAYQSSGYARACNLYKYAKAGGTLNALMEVGAIPINQITSYQEFFKQAKADSKQTNKQTEQTGR